MSLKTHPDLQPCALGGTSCNEAAILGNWNLGVCLWQRLRARDTTSLIVRYISLEAPAQS